MIKWKEIDVRSEHAFTTIFVGYLVKVLSNDFCSFLFHSIDIFIFNERHEQNIIDSAKLWTFCFDVILDVCLNFRISST